MGRIQKGLVPDGSGDPIGDQVLSDIYLVLKGRTANQDAHGGTLPGGTLTLSSTLHPTKGMVYLGDAKQTAYDEVNERIGINQPTPLARLHITNAQPSQVEFFTADSQIGSWSGRDTGGNVVATNIYTCIDDTDNTDYIVHDNLVGGSQYEGIFSGMTDPGVLGPFTLTVSIRETSNTNTGRFNQFFFTDNPSGGGATLFSQTDPPQFSGFTNGFAIYTKSITFTQAPTSWTTGFRLLFDIAFSISPPAGNVQIGYVDLTLPGGTVVALQEWNQPGNTNTLSFQRDGNNNTGLTFQGDRIAVSASAFALSSGGGPPAAGMIVSAQDSIGTMHWSSASALATLQAHRFVVQGRGRPGALIDGAWTPTKALTLSKVRFYRKIGGSASSVQFDLTKNGTTMLSAPVSIAFNANGGASATADATISVTTIAAGDEIAASAVQFDTNPPANASYELLVEAY